MHFETCKTKADGLVWFNLVDSLGRLDPNNEN
jgi:hypothetical protein